MIEIVENHLKEIRQVCKDMAVEKLYLFGSAARGRDFDESSDIDFLFRFHRNIEQMASDVKPDYFDLLFKLEKVLGRKVDLVWIDGVKNPYFIQAVKKDMQPVYEA